MDYYDILGVQRNASQDEIKRAYRQKAMKHHPDRGGDEAKFKEIEEAYRVLGDEQQRAAYDAPQPQFHGFHFNTGNMEDIFSQFGFGPFGGFRQQRMNRNRTVTVRVEMTLKEIITGKDLVGSIRLPSGREQTLELKIPPGVSDGDAVKFRGLGDDSIPGVERGDLIAQIMEIPDPTFHRDGINIIMDYSLSVFDAILGKKITVKTPEDRELEVNLPAGLQPGQLIKCSGHGIPRNGGRGPRGDLYIRCVVTIPKITNERDQRIIDVLRDQYGS